MPVCCHPEDTFAVPAAGWLTHAAAWQQCGNDLISSSVQLLLLPAAWPATVAAAAADTAPGLAFLVAVRRRCLALPVFQSTGWQRPGESLAEQAGQGALWPS